jgi:hypothetical protein
MKEIKFEDCRYISSTETRSIHYHMKSMLRHRITDSHFFAKVNEDGSVWISLIFPSYQRFDTGINVIDNSLKSMISIMLQRA